METQGIDSKLMHRVRGLHPQELDIALGVLAIVQRNPTNWDDSYMAHAGKKMDLETRILTCLTTNHQLLLDWQTRCNSTDVLPFVKKDDLDSDAWRGRLGSLDGDLTKVLNHLTTDFNRTQLHICEHNRAIESLIRSEDARFVYLAQNGVGRNITTSTVLFIKDWHKRHLQTSLKLYTVDTPLPGEWKEAVGNLYLIRWSEEAASISAESGLSTNGDGTLLLHGEHVGVVEIMAPKKTLPGTRLRNGLCCGTHTTWRWDPYGSMYVEDTTSNGRIDIGLTCKDTRVQDTFENNGSDKIQNYSI